MAVTVKQRDERIECKILKLMLFNENAIDTVIEHEVVWDQFANEYHQQVFAELLDIYRDSDIGGVAIGSDIDILFNRMIDCFGVGDSKKITSVINSIKSVKADLKMINIYIQELKKYTKIRKIVEAQRTVSNYLRDNVDNVDADELVRIYDESYQNVFADVISDANSLTTADLTDRVLRGIIEDIESPSVIKFGLSGLDDYCKLLNGYLTYIAGDTGIGKTTVATHFAATMARNGSKVLFINLETNSEDCLKKLISSCVSINNHRIKYTRLINPLLLNDKDLDVIEGIADQKLLNNYGIYWIYKPDMTVEEVRREVARHVRMYDIDVVIGDYYQLLRMEGREDDFPASVIPKVSNSLMTMAGLSYINPDGARKKIVHIWLSQVNKEVIHRVDKHPTKDDLYFGGARDARLVLGIYRDEYYNPDNTDKPGIMELGILKQNNGIAGNWFDYIFDAQHQSIRDMTDEEKELMGGDDEDETDE